VFLLGLNCNVCTENSQLVTSPFYVDIYYKYMKRLPPGPQVLATEEKYPTQQYRRGTPRKLLRLAKEDALGLKSTETKDTSNHLEDKQRYDVDDFEALLRSSYICAWGECYGPKAVKKRA